MSRRTRSRLAAAGAAVLSAFLTAMPPVSARQVSEPAKKDMELADGSRRQAFSVVLLLGDMEGGATLDGVPAAARKALADTKDFLPYKNYRLLDSQWTLCCSGTTSAVTRLRGVDDQEYELELRANPMFARGGVKLDPRSLSIRFVLRELADVAAGGSKSGLDRTRDLAGRTAVTGDQQARAAQIAEELFKLEREQLDLKTEAAALQGRVAVGTADPEKLKRIEGQLHLVTRRIVALNTELNAMNSSKPAAGTRTVIDTSFQMDVGETVVVGTSGLRGGNKALIALLTAVAKPQRPR